MFVEVHVINEINATEYTFNGMEVLNANQILKIKKLTNDALENLPFTNEKDVEYLSQHLGENSMKESPSQIILVDGTIMEVAESITRLKNSLR